MCAFSRLYSSVLLNFDPFVLWPDAGSTVGYRNDVGSAAPERLYLLEVTQPTRVTVTTCPLAGVSYASGGTKFEAYLRLYDRCPKFDAGTAAVLLAENNPAYYCAYLTYTLRTNGTYWLMLEGTSSRQSGNFELYLECLDAPSPR